jgi:hypothetical protein
VKSKPHGPYLKESIGYEYTTFPLYKHLQRSCAFVSAP